MFRFNSRHILVQFYCKLCKLTACICRMAAIGIECKDKNLQYDKWWENYIFFSGNFWLFWVMISCSKTGLRLQSSFIMCPDLAPKLPRNWISVLSYYLKTIKPVIFLLCCRFWNVVIIHEHVFANVDQVRLIYLSQPWKISFKLSWNNFISLWKKPHRNFWSTLLPLVSKHHAN